jgi:hypothetical protein
MEYVRSLRPENSPEFNMAWSLLAGSDRTRIAHLDAGLAAHEGIGWTPGEAAPANLRISEGRNVFDPAASGEAPLTPMTQSGGLGAGLIEWPDHGIKTLSVLLSDCEQLRGVVPGATVVPYRVANGPLFRYGDLPEGLPPSATASIGRALDLAIGGAVPARVANISMGNPGLGPLDLIVRGLLGGEIGMARSTGKAVDRAWDAGLIMVCAAGQIINTVLYPARYGRTIAVGGYDKIGGLLTHYPPQGYQDQDRIDIWAQAQRINRAGLRGRGADAVPVWAEDDGDGGDPSGTSYAAPQVAAAAALWVETHHARLEELFGDQRWQIVESFRAAVRASADREMARIVGSNTWRRRAIRVLNIPRLLKTPPSAEGLTRPDPAASGGFW